MTDPVSNDNELVAEGGGREPDAHGQAALLLVETLIHVLVEGTVITVADAVSAVDTAIEVKEDTGHELGDSPTTMTRSLALLEAIRASLRRDLPSDKDQASDR